MIVFMSPFGMFNISFFTPAKYQAQALFERFLLVTADRVDLLLKIRQKFIGALTNLRDPFSPARTMVIFPSSIVCQVTADKQPHLLFQ
jgi:hypothetical protein